MSRNISDTTPVAGEKLNSCWKNIGVWGDRSCPELQKVGHCYNCGVFTQAARQLQDRPVPPDYLEEWTKHLAQPAVDKKQATVSWLAFRVGAERLALPLANVVEVTEERPIHHLPHRRNPVLRGLINVRGELIVCVSLGALLGVEPAKEEAKLRRRVLVLQGRHGRYCMVADEVTGTLAVAANELQPLPATLSRAQAHHTESMLNRDGVWIGCLSAGRLFAALDDVIK
ncbi:MAG TPA: chemotaxis protein CheW [Verrucomicrobiae bacterium]